MTPRKILICIVLAAAALMSGAASAHGVRFGFHFGVPLFAPWYYAPPPVYYYPAPVYTVPPAPAYVEQQVAPPPEHYWYYCPDSQTYYPYVRECSSTWQRVTPRPPGS